MKNLLDRVTKVTNQVTIFGEELTDKRAVEKVLMSLPKRFETKISSFGDSKDYSTTSLAELVNALQTTEQKSYLTMNDVVEGIL